MLISKYSFYRGGELIIGYKLESNKTEDVELFFRLVAGNLLTGEYDKAPKNILNLAIKGCVDYSLVDRVGEAKDEMSFSYGLVSVKGTEVHTNVRLEIKGNIRLEGKVDEFLSPHLKSRFLRR